MRILGVETSCDETGVALFDSEKGLLGHCLFSQVGLHGEYGGVVPELASRDHIRKLLPLVDELFAATGLGPQDVDGVAYTAGPGLMGALMVGACTGRALAYAWGVPAVAVHHMEGHLLAPLLEPDPPAWPFVALLVSGGHSQIYRVDGLGQYDLLGETLDDAAGEAFDKAAKMLGLGYPGGPALAAEAATGDRGRFRFPRPMVDRPGLDLSFSGLKTHTLNCIGGLPRVDGKLDPRDVRDVAACFEHAVVETLAIKCRRALQETGLRNLVVAGGVGANRRLRERLQQAVEKLSGRVFYPRPEFCTDNGAMIAHAGCLRLLAGATTELAVRVHPRWEMPGP